MRSDTLANECVDGQALQVEQREDAEPTTGKAELLFHQSFFFAHRCDCQSC